MLVRKGVFTIPAESGTGCGARGGWERDRVETASRHQSRRPAAAARVITGPDAYYALNDKLKRISIIWASV